MRITISSVIETDAKEETIFNEFKKWMIDNFQNFRFSVSGKGETLNYKTGREDNDNEKTNDTS